MIWWSDALAAFDSLPLAERLFVRARAFSAPLEALTHRVVGQDVVDVGCGHGVLVAMLASRPRLQVTGIDPDSRKIGWAQQSVGRLKNVSLAATTVEHLPPTSFDTMCIADVIYLLPHDDWPAFFSAAFKALRPGGRLLLKEAENDGSWRASKALWQERLMVRVFRRTHSSGAIQVARREAMSEALLLAGFKVTEIVPLGDGFTTPHVLFVAEKGKIPSG